MEKDLGQSHKQTNELICWLIEHRLSIKSPSMFAVLKNKKGERKEKQKGHDGTNWETEGGRLWDKSFLKHHKGLDVTCHLTCRNFRNDTTPPKLKGKEQTQEEGWDGLHGRTEILFCAKRESSWEGGIERVHVCVYMPPSNSSMTRVCLRLCHQEQQLSWEHSCQRNRHISIIVFVLLVNRIQYHPPSTHTNRSLLLFLFWLFFSSFFSCFAASLLPLSLCVFSRKDVQNSTQFNSMFSTQFSRC